ncbi:MAG: hypothetical protein RBS56_05020 [Candidatus Gracilibacteria bacterium]|jgi:hypothetical protein|nr:hypothetical protein [Candidatus Gracilibacteria bacterium]
MIKIKIQSALIIAMIFVGLLPFRASLAEFSLDSIMSPEEQADTAATILDQYIDDNLSLGRCIYKGNIDFILFMQTLIYSDGFVEGVLEPFRDIFSRNQCQSSDVMGLILQRDKIRDNIRDAFLNCRNDRIPLLRRAYTLVNAEIYYVRHVVDGAISLSLPFGLLDTINLQSEESLYTDDTELYDTMKERYVGEVLSEDEFEAFYKGLRAQYKERKKEYVNCENDSFGAVVEKFNEFIENFGGLLPAYQDAEKRLGGRAEKIYEAITDPGLLDYAKNLINLNINDQDPALATEDFIKYLAEYGSFPGYNRTDTRSLITMLGDEEMKYFMSLEKAEMASSFEFLYRENTDKSAEQFINELEDLNKTLANSMDALDIIYDGVVMMNLRQCTNK